MDIRIEKTEKAIKAAFLAQRARRPLEKIKVKELCEDAQINKSTFYAHYQDIYALSDAMEGDIVRRILDSLPQLHPSDLSERPEWLTIQIYRAIVEHSEEVAIVFSGSRQGIFINQLEAGLRERVSEEEPDYWDDPVRRVLLSFCVQGSNYAFYGNRGQIDETRLVEMLGAIARVVQSAAPLLAATDAKPDKTEKDEDHGTDKG